MVERGGDSHPRSPDAKPRRATYVRPHCRLAGSFRESLAVAAARLSVFKPPLTRVWFYRTHTMFESRLCTKSAAQLQTSLKLRDSH